ncbi:MAG: hypothetical protein KUG78_16410 [Kangiellaceae bacterium]|nr:hypothetical protein [Kangiellaceae bacterium]
MKRSNPKASLLIALFSSTLALTGCNQSTDSKDNKVAESEKSKAETAVQAKKEITTEIVVGKATDNLQAVIDAQPEKVKARYDARHPSETLSFFEIETGQTVVEALPGGGWYSKILLPALGNTGGVIGADYAADMYPKFGFFSDKALEEKKTWVDTWTAKAEGWRDENSAAVSAYQFGSMPVAMDGTADRVLFIRALHNLARFEGDGEYLTKALADTFKVLKSGGIVGIVQHKASEEASDDWANGSNGYLKASFVKAKMVEAGFEFVAESDININLKDIPTEKDIVWRLAPSFFTSRDNPELKKQIEAIGESTRMTLKFRKP